MNYVPNSLHSDSRLMNNLAMKSSVFLMASYWKGGTSEVSNVHLSVGWYKGDKRDQAFLVKHTYE